MRLKSLPRKLCVFRCRLKCTPTRLRCTINAKTNILCTFFLTLITIWCRGELLERYCGVDCVTNGERERKKRTLKVQKLSHVFVFDSNCVHVLIRSDDRALSIAHINNNNINNRSNAAKSLEDAKNLVSMESTSYTVSDKKAADRFGKNSIWNYKNGLWHKWPMNDYFQYTVHTHTHSKKW